MISTATRGSPESGFPFLTAAGRVGPVRPGLRHPDPAGPGRARTSPTLSKQEPSSARKQVSVLEAEVGYVDEDGTLPGPIDSAGEGLYFDEDGVLQVVDPEVEVRIRRTLDRLRTTLESERARLRATDARTGEKIPVPEDLWIALGSGAESVSSRREIAEVANELAMEVRRLATKVQAGEMTRDEAGRTLRARLDSKDPPR